MSALFGIVVILISVGWGALSNLPDSNVVFDPRSIFLVLGGTVGAFLISFQMESLQRIQSLVLNGFFKSNKYRKLITVAEIVNIANNPPKTSEEIKDLSISHKFLVEGLILTLDDFLDNEDFEFIIHQRLESFKRENGKDQATLLAIAKFPPAFGLLGSVTGIIAMLLNLGDAGKEVIGQGMALALLTTFWGIAVSNIVVLPLADFCGRMNREDNELRELIFEGVIAIKNEEAPQLVARKLRSLLTLKERIILREMQANLMSSFDDDITVEDLNVG